MKTSMALPPAVLAPLSRRAFIIGTAAAATSVASALAVPRRIAGDAPKKQLDALIPKEIGGWRYLSSDGVVASAENDDADIYDDLLTRVYEAPGQPPIMLLIAYGRTQGGNLQLHRPETCYPGQGFILSDSEPRELHFGDANIVKAGAFTAKRDQRIERLIYWTRIGDRFPRNSAQEYMAIFASVVRRTVPDGVLVRVSAIGQDTVRSDKAVDSFAHDLVRYSGKDARRLLLGDAMATAIAETERATAS
jgi:EpsI family protein